MEVVVTCGRGDTIPPIFTIRPEDDYRLINPNPEYEKWRDDNGLDPDFVCCMPEEVTVSPAA
jgi:hypothetical protein